MNKVAFYTASVIGLLTILSTQAQTVKKPTPLAFPTKVYATIVPNQENQVIEFSGTNTVNKVITITGYESSCGCTSLEAESMEFKPNTQVRFRVQIKRPEPTVQNVLIKDNESNYYLVLLETTNAVKKSSINFSK